MTRPLAAAAAGCIFLSVASTLALAAAGGALIRPNNTRDHARLAGSTSLESAVAQSGRHYYLRYCASCHGWEAEGDGAVAPALVTKPPDLRTIAKRNKGEFPMDAVAATIDGRELPTAHGLREMPVWGERFGEEFRGDPVREQVIRGQLLMLLVYLQSIQH